jgi:hypothetical protein
MTDSTRDFRVLLSVLVLLLTAGCNPITSSHVDVNVPKPDDFNAFLERDVAAYFSNRGIDVARVEHEMLREGPTQTGIAYPKFYVWVRAIDKAGSVEEGAARIAAMDQVRFEVTDYLSKEDILSNPAAIDSVFPQAVCEKIRLKLK